MTTTNPPWLPAAKHLRRVIPAPASPKAKPAASWRQLKPGQWLRSLQAMGVAGRSVYAGELWKVLHTDSLGARLVHWESQTQPTWTLPEWRGVHFDRARKPKEVR